LFVSDGSWEAISRSPSPCLAFAPRRNICTAVYGSYWDIRSYLFSRLFYLLPFLKIGHGLASSHSHLIIDALMFG
jgi:hypothetical protein